ncbi:related to spermine/spermidine synthase family protein [Ramularia collo-cygni]|uniref:Related to spermine/spermidine synthase family protein n=1 Tax=Ramularia collo-cygni TaxID=112498 RepID=A0A2D3V7M4_9PEZI|nr:related to spermine/spermidine synthase family protein [Ramularia collo-cygni]CZT20757.1 related to spermine/spermidine synthase family protein [Ramularia collo-cygni]
MAIAQKQKKKTMARSSSQASTAARRIGLSAAILTLAAATSSISQLTMAPVFGSMPSSANHIPMTSVSVLLGILLQATLKSRLPPHLANILSVWAFWIPVMQTLVLHYSADLDITAGPSLNGFISCYSVQILAAYAVAEVLGGRPNGSSVSSIVRYSIASVLILIAFTILQTNLSSPVAGVLSRMPMLTPVHLQIGVAASYAILLPSRYWLALPALAHTAYWNPHFRSSLGEDLLRSHNWTLVDRKWSNTGYISVLDNSDLQYRLLRADHSLLGGEWLLTTNRKEKEGWLVPESVYAVFSILESVRLLRLTPEVPETQAQALVIGLGIGTAPKALISHGINTTIVELDPVVHSFATQYFGLPTNHTAVLQDAVSWVSSASSTGGIHYDYIIHDVFTGGAEPLSLFTASFLKNLRSLLTPNGAVALNYAGDLSLPLTKLVINTINIVFKGQCKIFRDSPLEAKNQLNSDQEEDFLNMVIFCRNTPGPISFRRPVKADFLGSKSREHYMLPKAELEIQFPRQDSRVLDDGDEEGWSGQQAESAKRHWRIMRKVLPDVVWELW